MKTILAEISTFYLTYNKSRTQLPLILCAEGDTIACPNKLKTQNSLDDDLLTCA